MSFIRKVKVGKYVYLQEVESIWENGKSKHKYIRTVGREVDGKRVLNSLVDNTDLTKVTVYGPLLALHGICKILKLLDELGEYSKEILCMVYSHCIDSKSLNKMEEWFSRTELNHILDLPNITEKRLVNALDSINKEERIDYFQQKIYQILKDVLDLQTDTFFYDVTNIYFFGKECNLSKRSKSKEGGYKRTVQIGLAVNKFGIPIFHKTFPGNVFDSRTLFDIMKHLPEYNIKKSFLVWDRGVTSNINISDAKKLGFEVICGIKNHKGIKKEVEKIIDEQYIIQQGSRIQLKSCSFYVKRINYGYEGSKGYLYICLNRKQRVELQEKRLKKIYKAKEEKCERKTIDLTMEKYFTKKGRIKKYVIAEKEKYDGFSFIFSTKNIDSKSVVERYFEKDIVEKAFACLKGVTKVRPIRKWLDKRVKAHIFICYISYLLLSTLNYKLSEKKLQFNAIEAINILETMYKAYLKDSKTGHIFTKIVTLTKNQEQILKAIDKKLLKPSN